MFLNLIRIRYKDRFYSFKTVDSIKKTFKCEIDMDTSDKLLKMSLTSDFAYVSIDCNVLTITAINTIHEGLC